jgi:predicted phage baseplate assembly protein
VTGCGCDPQAPGPAVTVNPPGQPRLRRRAAVHAASLARMRAALGARSAFPRLRALATQPTEDPSVALLDAWAVVADVVSFYSERIAEEGFLRTATERRSVRELARTLGYELRPGVAAQVELAFDAETAPGAPEEVFVPRGTPVQSVPGQGELPQVFETSADLEVRGAWNELPGVDGETQVLGFGTTEIWLRGSTTDLRPGDAVLVVGQERRDYGRHRSGKPRPHGTARDVERWDLRVLVAVDREPEGFAGWTRLRLDRRIGYRRTNELVAERGVTVHAFAERAALFGWNAPDPGLLVVDGQPPPGVEPVEPDSEQPPDDEPADPPVEPPAYRWVGYAVTSKDAPDVLEIDGDRTSVLEGPDSWAVLDQPGTTEAYRVEAARPDGTSRYAVNGRITRVRVDITNNLERFDRRRAVVHCGSRPLPAAEQPAEAPVGGSSLRVRAADPPLPPGRTVLVEGVDALTGQPAAESATVVSCSPDGTAMTLVLAPPLTRTYQPRTVRVRGNVVAATHGETVEQVLGSGDGHASFTQLRPRRGPLTYVRSSATADGARPELVLRVDDAEWEPVPSLEPAGPSDRVYVLRQDEDGATRIVLGDGTHGARPPTGVENIRATYRVGIGATGAVGAGQVSLLVRRPLGLREVANPAAATDWAPPETLEQARSNAPLRVRALDRAVSVRDHEDLARGFAGVGPARADLLWDGRSELVAVTVLGSRSGPVSPALLADLRTMLEAARDPGTPLALLTGRIVPFGLRLALRSDPAYERDAVEARVIETLNDLLGAPVRSFAEPVTAGAVLVAVQDVPGVLACTLPSLLPLGSPGADPALPPVLPPPAAGRDLLVAAPARFDEQVLPAELLALAPGGVDVREMAP